SPRLGQQAPGERAHRVRLRLRGSPGTRAQAGVGERPRQAPRGGARLVGAAAGGPAAWFVEVGEMPSTLSLTSPRPDRAGAGASTFDLAGLGPRIAPGGPEVEACFRLGWHLAELYGLPVEVGGRLPPGRLPGADAGPDLPYLDPPNKLEGERLSRMLQLQIASDVGCLVR